MERNRCTESGCKAFCCFGPKFPPLKINKEKILKWFPYAEQVRSIGLAMAENKRGVYFKKTGDKYIIKIIGYCPNLDEKFNCKLEDTDKPGPCTNFILGEDECTDVRITHFLEPYREWVYLNDNE